MRQQLVRRSTPLWAKLIRLGWFEVDSFSLFKGSEWAVMQARKP